MEFDGIELRELERITEPDIPAGIKKLFIDSGTGDKIEAQTTDFNIKGIRLLIPAEQDQFDHGESIIITPGDNSFRLIGEIRHVVRIDNAVTYLGIKFFQTKSLLDYGKVIDTYD